MRRMGLLILGALLAVCFCPPGSSAFARSRTTAADARLARIHTVKVSWGRIGYRDVGSGPPLLMLIGGGLPAPSIDDWPPQLINLLARQHHVFAMDYEGIGQSTGRTGTLTIPRLADDAAAFLTAMHIERADVLGWSMGSYVAQTLAIRHPKQVRRLVLCATALGDGSATQASVTGQQQYPGEWLFPQDSQNQARANAFEKAVHSYPRYYEGPDSVAVKELVANFEWVSGAVSEGHHAKRISAPTLVGGGAQDVLLPPPDSADVAKALPNASLHIYEDAGHGFLVQHESDWTSRVDRFLIRTSH